MPERCVPQFRQEDQRADRHLPPQNLRPPPLRRHLNLQSSHVCPRGARGVPSYSVSYTSCSVDIG